MLERVARWFGVTGGARPAPLAATAAKEGGWEFELEERVDTIFVGKVVVMLLLVQAVVDVQMRCKRRNRLETTLCGIDGKKWCGGTFLFCVV